jgi:hypothetical protein
LRNERIRKYHQRKATHEVRGGLVQQRFGAIGVLGFIKVGFVLGSSVLNLHIWLTKSPTDAKPQDVICKRSGHPANFDRPLTKQNLYICVL